jgi:MFS family permease
MIVTGVAVAILPLLWMISRQAWWAWLLQVYAGLFWSGFNLGAGNFLLDSVRHAKRARCTAYFHLIVGSAILVSGLLGSAIVGHLPQTYKLFGFQIHFASGFYALLILSFALRVITLLIFLPKIREVRNVPNVSVAEMLFRPSAE